MFGTPQQGDYRQKYEKYKVKYMVLKGRGLSIKTQMEYLKKTMENIKFSGAVMMFKNDKIQEYASNNKYLNGRFCIASCSKQITATAIMMCIEKGLLVLDDKVTKFITSFPHNKVTIKHLLCNSSGLPFHYTRTYEEYQEYWQKDLKLETIIYMINKMELLFEPGKKFMYSNCNWFLLSYIIELVSGLSFDEFIKDNIFDKLGMTNSGLYGDIIEGYDLVGYKKKAVPKVNTYIAYGAGGIYSTLKDMHNFITNQDKLLKSKTLEMMRKSYVGPYGFGWFLKNNMIFHDGGGFGYTTWICLDKKENSGLIILCNLNNLRYLSKIVYDIMIKKMISEPVRVTKKYYVPDNVIGEYKHDNTTINIRENSGSLYFNNELLLLKSGNVYTFADNQLVTIEFFDDKLKFEIYHYDKYIKSLVEKISDTKKFIKL